MAATLAIFSKGTLESSDLSIITSRPSLLGAATLLSTYSNQLDQVSMVKTAKHFNFSQEFSTALYDQTFSGMVKEKAKHESQAVDDHNVKELSTKDLHRKK
ncbi:hypothetical protein SDJN02_14687, partial [Cucurbita argyrosperma subsp. argyrosperma]